MSFVIFMLVVAALGAGAYLFLFMTHVPGAEEERLGHLEPLPEHLGQWVADEHRDEAGLQREVRVLHEPGGAFGGGKLITQVRYRDPESQEIVRVEPEQKRKRRRMPR